MPMYSYVIHRQDSEGQFVKIKGTWDGDHHVEALTQYLLEVDHRVVFGKYAVTFIKGRGAGEVDTLRHCRVIDYIGGMRIFEVTEPPRANFTVKELK